MLQLQLCPSVSIKFCFTPVRLESRSLKQTLPIVGFTKVREEVGNAALGWVVTRSATGHVVPGGRSLVSGVRARGDALPQHELW